MFMLFDYNTEIYVKELQPHQTSRLTKTRITNYLFVLILKDIIKFKLFLVSEDIIIIKQCLSI